MHKLRLLLLPFSWLYGCITGFRNLFYNLSIFKSFAIPKKSICVGNLSVGGTGKTPHVAYIVNLIYKKHSTTILSRGYGRKTKGYIIGNESSSSKDIGDEPKLYKKRFKNDVNVVVCESRTEGVKLIQSNQPKNEVIVLDDAYQHRAVKAELNILITDFNSLYSEDFVLPAGNLREWKIGRKRAQVLVVSKCPKNLSEQTKNEISINLKFPSEKVFFSSIIYGEILSFDQKKFKAKKILLVTGISNPKPLFDHLSKEYQVALMKFPDHYRFTDKDIQGIHQKFDTFVEQDKAIITTEKDFMRLSELSTKTTIEKYPWFYQTIEVKIDREIEFNALINTYVDTI